MSDPWHERHMGKLIFGGLGASLLGLAFAVVWSTRVIDVNARERSAARYVAALGIEGRVSCCSTCHDDCTVALASGQLLALQCDEDACRLRKEESDSVPIVIPVTTGN